MIKYDDLMRDLRQGKIPRVCLFFGDEDYLIQEAVDLIVAKTVDPGSRDFNFEIVHCKSATGSDLAGLCQTLPFMADRRLVIAREIEALKGGDLDELLSYLQSPAPSTCLVLLSGQPRYDKKAVVSAVEKEGAVTRFFPLLDRQMVSWIEGWAAQRGLSMRKDAAQYVWQTLGNDLQAVHNELQKVAIFVGERKTVTYEDVKAVVGDFREYGPFDLADAVGRKNTEKALAILGRLVQEGEQPVGLLASLAWNFRRLLRAKSLEASGVGFEEIKRKLGVIFHQSASFQEQMRSYSLRELRGVFPVLTATDRALKSGGLSGRLVLERTILELCGAV